MTVSIVCDSAASLPADVTAGLQIVTVPMELEIGGQPVSEADVSLDEIVARLDDGVKTSGPAPGSFIQAIEGADEGGGVVVLTVAERYSSTYQSATMAASMCSNPERVRVIDTGSAAGGEGLVVLAAAERAATGADLDEVSSGAERAAAGIRLVAAVEELRYLVRGGRIPASAARFGTQLGVHILFELRPSGPRPLRPSLHQNGVAERIVGQWRRTKDPTARLHVAALHALRPEEADDLLRAVRREVEPASAFVGTFGPVMVAHTGPGVIGLSWWWE